MSQLIDNIIHTVERRKADLLAVVVHLNDTYLIDERPARGLPGFARVIATVNRLRQRVCEIMGEDKTLVVHSGDFLGPSRVGKNTKGAVMIELLNRLTLDWCVLGNHEFDYGEQALTERVRHAKFGITMANVSAPQPFKVESCVLWPSPAQPLVAITGIVSDTVHKSFPPGWQFSDPQVKLAEFDRKTETLVPYRLVLSHATRTEDRQLRKGLGARLLFLGGHDHDIDWVETDTQVPIMKNKSNLETVRVIVLAAGGASAYFQLRGAALELENTRFVSLPAKDLVATFDRNDLSLIRYPEDCEQLLAKLPAADARVFRQSWSALNPDALQPPHSMLSAIERLPNYSNFNQFLLRAQDHDPVDPEDEKFVAANIPQDPDEEVLIKDARQEYPEGLDARDEAVRSRAAGFAMFVARCVRRAADADIAILNAGSFRADAVLPSELHQRDLADCFLYDNPECIVVLDLPRPAVVALLQHGRTLVGEGGYPQASPLEPPNRDLLRVAIVSYLLENERSIDGYDQVLARVVQVASKTLRETIEQSAIKRFAIMPAVRQWAAQVSIPSVDAIEQSRPPLDQFLDLARALYAADAQIDYQDLRLGNDDVLENTQLQLVRDRIRAWLRALPEVAEGDALIQGVGRNAVSRTLTDEEQTIAQKSRSMEQLYYQLEDHRAKFRDGRNYHKLLERLAEGIGGWQGP